MRYFATERDTSHVTERGSYKYRLQRSKTRLDTTTGSTSASCLNFCFYLNTAMSPSTLEPRIPLKFRILFPRFEFQESDVSDPKDDAETFEHADVARLARVSPPEPSGAAAATPVDLKPRAMLKRNGDAGVCRAVVYKQAVVIKFVISCDPRRIDALLNEGNLYGRQLKLLQGVAIPRLYAVCKGTADDKGFTLSVACLFFEDCGDPVTTPFIYLPMCDR